MRLDRNLHALNRRKMWAHRRRQTPNKYKLVKFGFDNNRIKSRAVFHDFAVALNADTQLNCRNWEANIAVSREVNHTNLTAGIQMIERELQRWRRGVPRAHIEIWRHRLWQTGQAVLLWRALSVQRNSGLPPLFHSAKTSDFRTIRDCTNQRCRMFNLRQRQSCQRRSFPEPEPNRISRIKAISVFGILAPKCEIIRNRQTSHRAVRLEISEYARPASPQPRAKYPNRSNRGSNPQGGIESVYSFSTRCIGDRVSNDIEKILSRNIVRLKSNCTINARQSLIDCENGYLALGRQHRAIEIKCTLHYDHALCVAILVRCGQYFCSEWCSVGQHSSHFNSEFSAKLRGDLCARSGAHL